LAQGFIQFKTTDLYKPGPVCDLIQHHIFHQTVDIGSYPRNSTVVLRPKTVDFTNVENKNECNCGSKRGSVRILQPEDRKYYCNKCLMKN
jgi:hypothetical protein